MQLMLSRSDATIRDAESLALTIPLPPSENVVDTLNSYQQSQTSFTWENTTPGPRFRHFLTSSVHQCTIPFPITIDWNRA